jgi:hypothetical protein
MSQFVLYNFALSNNYLLKLSRDSGNYFQIGFSNMNILKYKVHFFLWLYSPILGLGRLHETFRFISVTRSRTVSRTPWTGDQLVARPLLPALGEMVKKLVE